MKYLFNYSEDFGVDVTDFLQELDKVADKYAKPEVSAYIYDRFSRFTQELSERVGNGVTEKELEEFLLKEGFKLVKDIEKQKFPTANIFIIKSLKDRFICNKKILKVDGKIILPE